MRTTLFTAVIFVAAQVLIDSPAHCQTTTSGAKVGLSASLQNSQFDILLPIWTSERFSIAPAFGLVWSQDVGSDIHIGLVPRIYFPKERFSPYIGGRFGFLIASPENGNGTTDFLGGLSFGGEYFADEHFSFGAEAQLNATKSADNSPRFGNPGKWGLNTGAAAFVTMYF